MVATSQLQSELDRVSAGQAVVAGQTSSHVLKALGGSVTGLAAWVPTTSPSKTAVSRYLESVPAVQATRFVSFTASSGDDLLSDMAYGLPAHNDQSVMSVEPGSPLLRSTGQLLTQSDWSVLAQ